MISRFLSVLVLLGSSLASAAEAAAPTAYAAAPVVAPSTSRVAPVVAPVRVESAVAPTAPFDTFRAIIDRNIFSPYRTGRRGRSTDEVQPRLDTITLVGTMNSDRGLMSFFDGSDSAYRKALRVGESVEKFKITRIGPEGVDLDRDGKQYKVRVGQQFRRPEGSDWNLVAADLVRAEAQPADGAKVDPSAPVIPADADEVTKRMMQRRAQQLKQ